MRNIPKDRIHTSFVKLNDSQLGLLKNLDQNLMALKENSNVRQANSKVQDSSNSSKFLPDINLDYDKTEVSNTEPSDFERTVFYPINLGIDLTEVDSNEEVMI